MGGPRPDPARRGARLSAASELTAAERRRNVLALQAVFAVNGGLFGTLLPRYPAIADRLEASEGAFGLALLGVGVGGLLGSAAVTHVTRRAGSSRRVLRWMVPVMVVATVAAALAPSIPALFVALAVLGLVDGMVDPAMNTMGADRRVVGARPVMGRLHATWSGATLVATGIGALLAGLGVGLLPHVAGAAAVLLALQAVAVARLPAPAGAPAAAEAPGPDPASADTAPTGAAEHDSSDGRRRGTPTLWIATVVLALLSVWIELPPAEWSGLLLARELGTGPGLAGAAPFAAVGGVLATRLVLDRLVEAHGWRRVVVASMAVSAVGMGTGLWIGAATSSPWPVLVGLFLAGVGAASTFPMMFDRAEAIAARLGMPADAGPGFVSGVARAGILLAPVTIGQIADRSGLFVALATVPLGALLIAVAALVLLAPRDP